MSCKSLLRILLPRFHDRPRLPDPSSHMEHFWLSTPLPTPGIAPCKLSPVLIRSRLVTKIHVTAARLYLQKPSLQNCFALQEIGRLCSILLPRQSPIVICSLQYELPSACNFMELCRRGVKCTSVIDNRVTNRLTPHYGSPDYG